MNGPVDDSASPGAESVLPRSRPRVLLVEDDPARARQAAAAVRAAGALPWRVAGARLERGLTGDGCPVAVVGVGVYADGADGADGANGPPGLGGAGLARIRAARAAGCAVIAYAPEAGAWPLGRQSEPLLAGAQRLLDSASPTFAAELRELVARALESERSRQALVARALSLGRGLGIVGGSPPVVEVLLKLLRLGPLSDVPVLLCGETGTGKELLASAIHRLDPKRRGGPFVAVNCSAIQRDLAESELFGHTRGAFTGAERGRPGLFRAAAGGVLFLDEVSELEPAVQAKLLRVLQERRVQAVGADREEPVDVRVVAATNHDLAERVRDGHFRADLYFRLSALVVAMAPLRERPDDIAPLVHHFLHKHAALHPRALAAGDDFMAALRRMPFQGNVRQLENVVREVMVRKEDDDVLRLSDLPDELLRELRREAGNEASAHHAGAATLVAGRAANPPGAPFPAGPLAPPSRGPSAPAGAAPGATTDAHPDPSAHDPLLVLFERQGWALESCMSTCERLLVDAALRRTRGNQSAAARMLGVTPRTMYNKLRKHGLIV